MAWKGDNFWESTQLTSEVQRSRRSAPCELPTRCCLIQAELWRTNTESMARPPRFSYRPGDGCLDDILGPSPKVRSARRYIKLSGRRNKQVVVQLYSGIEGE